MNENELPLKLAAGVELVMYTRDQSCGVEMLESNGLLPDYEAAMARIDADIREAPDAVQMWIDILPCERERLLFVVTVISLGAGDCRGSLAAAQYSGPLEPARDCLYRWCERNALVEVEKSLGAETAASLN